LTNVSFGAEFPSTPDAAAILSLLFGVKKAIILLISTIQGCFGVGKFGN
jgi:hypothetical protein